MGKRKLLTMRQLERDKKRARRAGETPPPTSNVGRPKTRGDCLSGPRPCPWVGCRYHLFLDVSKRGSLRFPHGDDLGALEAMADTCALDVARRGGEELGDTSRRLGLSEFGSRLILNKALAEMSVQRKLRELAPHGPRDAWTYDVSKGQGFRRHAIAKAALRAFFDSPPERRGTP